MRVGRLRATPGVECSFFNGSRTAQCRQRPLCSFPIRELDKAVPLALARLLIAHHLLRVLGSSRLRRASPPSLDVSKTHTLVFTTSAPEALNADSRYVSSIQYWSSPTQSVRGPSPAPPVSTCCEGEAGGPGPGAAASPWSAMLAPVRATRSYGQRFGEKIGEAESDPVGSSE